MRLFLTDNSFKIHGQVYTGVPFLVDDEMALVNAPNDYLFYVSVVKGRTASTNTWQTYGNHLYEFFGFLEANDLRWDNINQTHLAAWRDSMLARGCARSTANQRLSAVSNFYKWALRESLMHCLPFQTEEVWIAKPAGFLAHVDAKGNRFQANELTLRTTKALPKFLLTEDARKFVTSLTPRRNRLMSYLMWLCGLRREEVAALNMKVLPNPSGHAQGKGLRMTLDAKITPTKGSKTRWVLVPYDLAVQLWDYMMFERSGLMKLYQKKHGKAGTDLLFLTEYGNPISLEGINNAFRKASEKSGVKCTPHMLRHTFGTYEFMRMSERKNTESALHWVRDRMGHSSITTTEVYVHAADLVSHDEIDGYQAEICELLRDDSNGRSA